MKKLHWTQYWRNKVLQLGLVAAFPEAQSGVLDLREYEKGEHITLSGMEPEGLYILLSGRVLVTPVSEEGNEVILTYLSPPEMLADIELINGSTYMHTTKADTKVTAIFIPRKMFFSDLAEQSCFLRYMLGAVTAKLTGHSAVFSSFRLYNVRDRLCRYILDRQDKLGKDVIPFSVRQTAAYIGLSERHLRRIVAAMQDEGLIEKMPRHLRIINTHLLRLELSEKTG